MFIEDNDLIYNKYICADCGKTVLAHTVEDVIKNEKLCIDCLTVKYSKKIIIKRAYSKKIKKETRPLTHKELLKKKNDDELKWGHLRNIKESK